MKKDELIYQLELTYLTKANIFDEDNKPIWPNGLATFPVRIQDKKEFDFINTQLKNREPVISLKKAGAKYGQQIQIRLTDVMIAQTNVYEPQPESKILDISGNKIARSVN